MQISDDSDKTSAVMGHVARMSIDWSAEPGYGTLKLDDGTEVWNYISQDDRNYPVFEDGFLARKDAIKKNFALREDDVMLLGYMKCGTHWLWEIVNMLLKGKAEVDSVHGKNEGFFESTTVDALDCLPSPRILSSHLQLCDLPPSLLKCKNKIIVPLRNPRDSAVSMYHHLTAEKNGCDLRCDWDTFISQVWFDKTRMVYATWVDYTLAMWRLYESSDNVLPVVYEQLQQNPEETISDLANFLELDVSKALVKEICDATSFSKMAPIKKSTEVVHESTFVKGYSMFRKGKVGDWKNHFSEKQTVEFDEKMDSLRKEHPELRIILMLLG